MSARMMEAAGLFNTRSVDFPKRDHSYGEFAPNSSSLDATLDVSLHPYTLVINT